MRFRKKPVVIEAVQYDGTNKDELKMFCPGIELTAIGEEGETYWLMNPRVHTPEGVMMLRPGNWLIRGIKGEFYPCDREVFEATYEPVEP